MNRVVARGPTVTCTQTGPIRRSAGPHDGCEATGRSRRSRLAVRHAGAEFAAQEERCFAGVRSAEVSASWTAAAAAITMRTPRTRGVRTRPRRGPLGAPGIVVARRKRKRFITFGVSPRVPFVQGVRVGQPAGGPDRKSDQKSREYHRRDEHEAIPCACCPAGRGRGHGGERRLGCDRGRHCASGRPPNDSRLDLSDRSGASHDHHSPERSTGCDLAVFWPRRDAGLRWLRTRAGSSGTPDVDQQPPRACGVPPCGRRRRIVREREPGWHLRAGPEERPDTVARPQPSTVRLVPGDQRQARLRRIVRPHPRGVRAEHRESRLAFFGSGRDRVLAAGAQRARLRGVTRRPPLRARRGHRRAALVLPNRRSRERRADRRSRPRVRGVIRRIRLRSRCPDGAARLALPLTGLRGRLLRQRSAVEREAFSRVTLRQSLCD